MRLRQSYRFVVHRLCYAQRYAHLPKRAKQARQALRKLHTLAGRQVRDLQRHWVKLGRAECYAPILALMERIVSQPCGLRVEDTVPDHSTLSRFRSELSEKRALHRLLTKLNGQLELRGVLVQQGGGIIDASITPTLCKPKGKPTYFQSLQTPLLVKRSDRA